MKKKAFTLAEVLITLVIIGVVAALTVPTLMNNTNAEEYRSGLKKAVSGLNQALAMNFTLEGKTAADYSSPEELVSKVFKKRMNVIDGDTTHTFGNRCYASEDVKFTTADGMMFCVKNFESDADEEGANETSSCSSNNKVVCGNSEEPQIIIDVNGLKKPNKLTTNAARPRDIYEVQLYAQRVVPYGDATQAVMMDAKKSNDTSGSEDVTGGSGSNDGGPEEDIPEQGGTEPSVPDDDDDAPYIPLPEEPTRPGNDESEGDPDDGPYEGPEPATPGGEIIPPDDDDDPGYVPDDDEPTRPGNDESEGDPDDPYYDPKEDPEPIVPPASGGDPGEDPFDDDDPGYVPEPDDPVRSEEPEDIEDDPYYDPKEGPEPLVPPIGGGGVDPGEDPF